LEHRTLLSYEFQILANFNGAKGANPSGSLVDDKSGNLFGAGSTIFELVKGGNKISVLSNGGANGGLVEDSNGNLFGTTVGGGDNGDGTIFEWVKSTGKISVLASFNSIDGADPNGGLVEDANGNLFGTCAVGGPNSPGYGTIFEWVKGTGKIVLLAAFNGTNGSNPNGGLVEDSNGNLFGTAYYGGPNGGTDFGSGTVFEWVKSTGQISVLADFALASNGAGPNGSLVEDTSGNLFGTTSYGSSTPGTVFEWVKSTKKISVLATFNGTDGADPNGGLVEDSNGNLFGTTYLGGLGFNVNNSNSGDGTVFEWVKDTGNIFDLTEFNGSNGANPLGGLIADGSSNLFGATYFGGNGPDANGDGTLFEFKNVAPVAATGTTISSAPNPSVYGQSVTFTVKVSPTTSGPLVPTGTVSFLDGSTTLDKAPLDSNGVASFTTSSVPVGSATITATYSGDADFLTSSVATKVIVNQASTTTSVKASPTANTPGRVVTLTATLSVAAPGGGTPTGSVQFFEGTTSLGVSQLTGKTATLTTSSLPVGTDSVTAKYLGNADYKGSTSSAVAVTINPGIATTTSLTASYNPSVSGQAVLFVATVTPPLFSGSPSGTVTFYHGPTVLYSTTLNDGVATWDTVSLPVGSKTITAVYSGDSNFFPSISPVLTQKVNQDDTSTQVTASIKPSVYGQAVTFTATVRADAPGSGTPTGSVTFYDGTSQLGAGSLVSGKTTFTHTFLKVSAHSITAVYGGAAAFASSKSAALTQTVNQDPTTTTVDSSSNPLVYGQGVVFTSRVTAGAPGSGMPTGTITFYFGSTPLGTSKLTNGTASFDATAPLPIGNLRIAASYNGDANFKTGSGIMTQTVNQDNTSTSVVSSLNPSVYGQAVTFSLVVSAMSPGSGIPTGAVTFEDSSFILGIVPLKSGTAKFTTSTLAAGNHYIKVIYGGDADFKSSGSQILKQVVNTSNGPSFGTGNFPRHVVGFAGTALENDRSADRRILYMALMPDSSKKRPNGHLV
jgi:uncharacterized repeat protein (TIGR03803 family)